MNAICKTLKPRILLKACKMYHSSTVSKISFSLIFTLLPLICLFCIFFYHYFRSSNPHFSLFFRRCSGSFLSLNVTPVTPTFIYAVSPASHSVLPSLSFSSPPPLSSFLPLALSFFSFFHYLLSSLLYVSGRIYGWK